MKFMRVGFSRWDGARWLSAVGAIAGALTAGIPFARLEPLISDLPGAPGHLEAVLGTQMFSVLLIMLITRRNCLSPSSVAGGLPPAFAGYFGLRANGIWRNVL